MRRDLSDKRYVHLWADGIYFNVRLTDERPCLLVIIGADAEGNKELVAMVDGERESKLSWKEALLDLRDRGLKEAPKLAVGNGSLGFWTALEEVFGGAKRQRCWVHKTANVLDKLPKSVQPSAKDALHQIYLTPNRDQAIQAWDRFMELFKDKYARACSCREKDRDALLTFYDYPAAHWGHLRTTNPIERAFATVRHRTSQTKGCGSRSATLAMVFQLLRQAQTRWRRLNGYECVADVIQGVVFIDGVETPKEKAA